MEEDLYLRWRELMVATHRHGGNLASHPKWQGLYTDFIERLTEDPFWLQGVLFLPHEVDRHPKMVFDEAVPEDELYAWTPVGKMETPTEFFGRTGFGRLTWATPREEGVMPWSEATLPKGKIITPDDPDDPVVA